MSINVNVSGNPIRINRGKLIAADLDYDKKDFDKRRRMRLEQVRHQSKEIAENVRNKVQKEKEKQLTDFEKREEDKLKKWQNRKLLELQQQYCESLKDIGLGHARAVIENTQDEIEEEYRGKQKQKAKERGDSAAQRLQADKNRQNLKKAIPLQHKKLTRDIENARSVMVSKHRKSPAKKRKKRKSNTNINITTNVTTDTPLESDVEELNLLSDDYDCTLSETAESGARRKRSKSPSVPSTMTSSGVSHTNSPKSPIRTPGSPRRPKSPQRPILQPIDVREYPPDTRISDRIMNRRLLLHPHKETCQQRVPDEDRILLQSQPVRIGTDKTTSMTESPLQKSQMKDPCSCKWSCCNHMSEENEIPIKPTVSLRDATTSMGKPDGGGSKVQYYDHNNRFSKEYVEKRPTVKKIPDENIQVCTCPCNEREHVERIFKNDKDAEVRGRKALEKVNVQKDYDEMLKQLPVLQKQERIATISEDKQTFHMDTDRLREHEKNQQNRMENMYERHFPKTITIPPKKHVIEDQPFKTVDVSEMTPALTVAEWDVDKRNGESFTLTKDCGNILIETDLGSSNKEDYLKYLLERLKLQKEMLLREAAGLPENSNLNSIINDLENLKGKDGLYPRRLSPQGGCPCPSPDMISDGEDIKLDKKSPSQKRGRQYAVSSSNSSTSSTPPKKRKHKRHKIVLQNTSTQTSPKTVVEDKENVEKNTSPSSKKHSPRKSKAKSAPSSSRSEYISKVSRPTSPISMLQFKDQASSPIVSDPIKTLPPEDTQGIEKHVSKCKCKSVEDLPKSCKCKRQKDREELCEILIKIKDNDEPEIRIKSPTKQKKITIDKTASEEDTSKRKLKLPSKRVVKINDKPSEKVTRSWRDQLSRNEVGGTSTSTSYFSPPDFSKSDFSRGPQAESTTTKASRYSSDTTGKSRRREIDERLLRYIRKLLAMSRGSIEDLGVSSVSDVSTLNASIFDGTRNNSLNQLRNVIKYFNINPEDLAYYLNYSDDTPGVTSGISGTSGSVIDRNSSPSTVHSSGYDASKSRLNNNNASTSFSDRSKTPTRIEADRDSIPTPLAQYADLAAMCEKRINDLTDMIKRVRMEKQQILSPGQSDKENSTQYMGLPPLKEKSQDTSSDLEQAEINRRMLEIDYDLAERLKTAEEQRKAEDSTPEAITDLERDLLERYRRLVNVNEDGNVIRRETSAKNVEFAKNRLSVKEAKKVETISPTGGAFTPLLMDIPRLPKLETNQAGGIHSADRHKRPPPAKGLIAAKKFNVDITTVPHELSTIVEVDSQLSTRIRPSSSSKQSPRCSPIRTFDNLSPVIVLPEFPTELFEKDKKQSEGSMPDILSEIATNTEDVLKSERGVQIQVPPRHSQERSTDSSTEDKSEMDNIEAMLKSMGMGWAISTLRKTKAVQKRASSSTSTDTISKEHSSSSIEENSKAATNNSSTSDVTLRDMLGKKIFSNSTSSSVSHSISPNLEKALDELSAIYGSGRSTENKHQRTSTPVQTTKSSESKKGEIFTAESEVSSVKMSDDYVTLRDETGNNSDV